MSTQGIRIKKIRQTLNLQQEEFGKIFGISKQYVSLLEKDKAFLNNDKLVKLLLDYKININYLLAGSGSMFVAPEFEKAQDEFSLKVEKILREKGLI